MRTRGFSEDRIKTAVFGTKQLTSFKKEISNLDDTLRLMNKLKEIYKPNFIVRYVAMSVIGTIKEKDKRAEAIWAYVHEKVRFIDDPVGQEYLQAPVLTLILERGDCDDQALVSAVLCESIGIPTRFVVIAFNGAKNFNHIFCEVMLKDKKFYLDTTAPYFAFKNYKTVTRVRYA